MPDTSLDKTFSSAGNRRTWTWSGWIKLGNNPTTSQSVFVGYTGSATQLGFSQLGFTSNKLFFTGWSYLWLRTTQVFRDSSAWYHVVLAVDTTQATADDRVKMYVNGSQITDFDTRNNPSQNDELAINAAVEHNIGSRDALDTTDKFDGYMAHVHFTDGTAYQASDFGETDTNGQWKPKTAPSVTYGTNGFFLKFANSGSLGTDSSGNGNNFTKSGSGDQVTDTPDNVFATFNPLIINRWANAGTPTKGNTEISWTSGDADTGIEFSTLGVPSGKWYWEVKMPVVARAIVGVGYMQDIVKNTNVFYDNNPSNGFAMAYTGSLLYDATSTTYGSSFSNNDILQVALDMDNHLCWFGLNGTWQNSATQTEIENSTATNDATTKMGTQQNLNSGEPVFPFVADTSTSGQAQFQINFGNPPFSITSGNTDDNGYGNFEYAPPSGYLALCTKNLSTELTLPIGDGKDYFNPVLYTGDGNNSRTVTGTGFQPDWVWVKVRNTGYGHKVFDSSRGTGKRLATQTNAAESTVTDELTSFDSDGFTTNNNAGMNENTRPFVAWQWRVNGGTTSTNTDGTITTTVQVNSTTKNSIITWTGDGSSGSTVGHGLGVTPTLVIAKVRSAVDNWLVFSPPNLNESKTLWMDSTDAVKNAGTYYPIFWNSTDPTSSVITLGNNGAINGNGNTYVAYCFRDVEGYSKFGTYTGNGSADGTFIYTGFRPAFTIIKKSSDIGIWFIYDTTRDIDNKVQHRLLANDAQAENTGSGDDIDIVSNGFKARSSASAINASGQTFFYMAFAENPFVDSTGRPATAR